MATYDLATTSPSFTSLRAGDIINCSYSGAKQSIDLPAGTYKLEVWGAEGGYRSSSSQSGKGGYSTGVLTLTNKTTLYIYSGGSGNSVTTATNNIYPGGFNGGGYRQSYKGGGGASDIRIAKDSLYARVIVAGGGGSDGRSSGGPGGAGGGTSGIAASSGLGQYGYGGTQTGFTTTATPLTAQGVTNDSKNCIGGFGFGGFGCYRSSGYGGAGGGGWYGGCGAYPDSSADDDKGGGGGSGYVYTSDTAANYPSGCLLNSNYYLANASTKNGTVSFVKPDGGNETGHTGNGYARITILTTTAKTTYIFNANGGTSTPASITVDWGTTKTLPSAINRASNGVNFTTLCYGAGGTDVTATGLKTANYTFAGWNTNAQGTGTNYNAGASISSTGTTNSITLYAKWNVNYSYSANNQIKTIPHPTRANSTTSFTIKGNCNGGINNTSLTGNQIISYAFTGWNSQYDGKGTAYGINSTATFDESTILYAQWSQTVSYNNNTINLLPIPTRSKYIFTGWNTAADGSGGTYPKGSTEQIKSAQTLYAQWQREAYNYVPFIYTNGKWVKMTPLIYNNGTWTNRLVDLK